MNPYDEKGEKGRQVREMFDTIAPKYDLLNRLMTFGIDTRWRRRLARMVELDDPARILDLATGTGDMAILFARRMPDIEITGADPSPGMLEVARQRLDKKGLSERVQLTEASAESLPFAEGDFDAATVVFGIRNFSDIAQGLTEITRVLKKGGKAYIMEFSEPKNKIFGYLYRAYFHRIVPLVGGWISGDRRAYSYLPRSVEEFPPVEDFLTMMRTAGLKDCRARRVFFGAAHIYNGVKP